MFSSSSLRNQDARWQNSVNSSKPEPSISISLMTSFSPSYPSLQSPISPVSPSALEGSVISDSVTGQICEESFLLGSFQAIMLRIEPTVSVEMTPALSENPSKHCFKTITCPESRLYLVISSEDNKD